jgi:hypothetical protein
MSSRSTRATTSRRSRSGRTHSRPKLTLRLPRVGHGRSHPVAAGSRTEIERFEAQAERWMRSTSGPRTRSRSRRPERLRGAVDGPALAPWGGRVLDLGGAGVMSAALAAIGFDVVAPDLRRPCSPRPRPDSPVRRIRRRQCWATTKDCGRWAGSRMTRSGALEPRERPDPRSSERRVAAVIVVDDLTRPTPDGTPHVLQELADAGIPPDARIPAEHVTILIAREPTIRRATARRCAGSSETRGCGVGFWSTTTEAGSRRPRRA